MSDTVWQHLAAPFAGNAVVWVPFEVAEAGDEVRVVALVVADALRERFDGVVGVGGWGVAYVPLDAGALACHVTIGGVTKGAVAPRALVGGPVATAEMAFARAAELFGLAAPFAGGATAWVPCDPETLAPLHPPEVEVAPAAAPPEVVVAPEVAAAATGAAPVVAATSAPSATPAAEKPTGQQMIDRLVDRLKDEGQGLAAARLLVRYGGYGKDPDTARELYAQLRALLRGELATAVGGPGGGAA